MISVHRSWCLLNAKGIALASPQSVKCVSGKIDGYEVIPYVIALLWLQISPPMADSTRRADLNILDQNTPSRC